MTNQPDAYTMAAQAAADRARAEALQRGGTQPGPGLQSPMRRLSKNPAARWVLSGVLLAAGTALAVDYVNGPLGPWIRYHWPVPGSGGKSGARIAAELTAKPQAEIDAATMLVKKKITGPVEAKATVLSAEYESNARELTMQITKRADEAMKAVYSDEGKRTKSPIALYEVNPDSFTGQNINDRLKEPIGQHWSTKIGIDPPSHRSLQDNPDFETAIENGPIPVPVDSTMTPLIYIHTHGVAFSEDNRGNTIIPVRLTEPSGKVRVGFVKEQDFINTGFTPPQISFYTDPQDKEVMYP